MARCPRAVSFCFLSHSILHEHRVLTNHSLTLLNPAGKWYNAPRSPTDDLSIIPGSLYKLGKQQELPYWAGIHDGMNWAMADLGRAMKASALILE